MPNRSKGRVDENHPKIVEQLRAMGCSVQSLADLGKGCPDILVGYRGKNYVFEIKNPDMPPSKRNLTEDEARWHSYWRGQVNTIETVAEAIEIMRP